MLAAPGPHWFDRRPPDSDWRSIGISVAITAAVFAASLASMTSVSLLIDRAQRASPPVMVPLQPPSPPPIPKPRPIPRVAPPKPAAPTTVPTEIAPPVVSTVPVAPPAVAPIAAPGPVVARTDTTTARAAQPAIPLGIIAPPRRSGVSDTAAIGVRVGAPIDRAGVNYNARAANTVAVRDSIAAGKMSSMDELLRTHPMKGRELAELQQSKQAADRVARRATTAGNSADVHVPMGEGLGGAGAVGGGKTGVSTGPGSAVVTVPLPLFSPGPSPAQRKRNEAIDADNQLRLRRLGDRVLMKRDSIRADSLRRDSLARRRIIP